MDAPTIITDLNASPAAKPVEAELRWLWTPAAVKAALSHAGRPPKLDIQSMLNAAFAVDGPNLTAMVFEVAIGTRIAELDAQPYLLDTTKHGSVELSGQFLLMLLSGRMDLLTARTVTVAQGDGDSGDVAQETLGLELLAKDLPR